MENNTQKICALILVTSLMFFVEMFLFFSNTFQILHFISITLGGIAIVCYLYQIFKIIKEQE